MFPQEINTCVTITVAESNIQLVINYTILCYPSLKSQPTVISRAEKHLFNVKSYLINEYCYEGDLLRFKTNDNFNQLNDNTHMTHPHTYTHQSLKKPGGIVR